MNQKVRALRSPETLTATTYRFATGGSSLEAPPASLPTLTSGTQPAWFGLK